MYTYRVLNNKELKSFLSLNRHETECNSNGWEIYNGFHYFKPISTFYASRFQPEPEVYNFVAFDGNQIIGVFKVTRNLSNQKDKELWIDFIDVHKEYRKQGVATKLYQLFNEWVEPEMILIGTRLSQDGESSNLHRLRTSIVTNCFCFTSKDELEEYQCKRKNQAS